MKRKVRVTFIEAEAVFNKTLEEINAYYDYVLTQVEAARAAAVEGVANWLSDGHYRKKANDEPHVRFMSFTDSDFGRGFYDWKKHKLRPKAVKGDL